MASSDPEQGAPGTPTDPAVSPALEPDRGFLETFQLRTGGGRDGAPAGPPAPFAALPLRIGHYVIEGVLGAGAFGLVCAARDVLTGARAAVKLVAREDRDRVAALHREAEWLASVNRPNIVKLFAQGEDHGYAWIATELVEGQSLAEILRDGANSTGDSGFTWVMGGDDEASPGGEVSATPQQQTRRERRQRDRDQLRRTMTWFRDIALALHDIHELDVIHRDVKPSNIVIHRGGTPYLIDFGLSISEFDTDGREIYLEGTLPYMSPEQASGGLGGIGPRSDLYSLAVTFHEALTGQRVVRGRYRKAILNEVIHEIAPPPSRVDRQLPSSLDPIFVKALQKEEHLRYPDGATLAADIDAWLQDRLLPCAPTPLGTRCLRLVRRRSDVAIPLALILVAAFAIWLVEAAGASRRDVVVRLRALAEEPHNDDRALALCLEKADLFRDDRGSPFWILYERVAQRSAQPRITEILRFQAVVIAVRMPEKRELGDSEAYVPVMDDQRRYGLLRSAVQLPGTRVARMTAEAQSHLRNLPEEAGFRFQAAFGLHLQDRNEEALALIPPVIGDGSSLEEELRAVCFLEEEDGEQRYLETVADLERRPVALRSLDSNEDLLAAYRELERGIQVAARDDPSTAAARYDRALELSDRVLAKVDDHTTALTLQSRIHLEREAHSRALQGFERVSLCLAAEGCTVGDQAGTWFYIAQASLILAAREDGGAAREGHVTRASAVMRPAIEAYPPLAGRLLHDLCQRGEYDAAFIWAREVLREPRVARARDCTEFIYYAAIVSYNWENLLPDDLDRLEFWNLSLEVATTLSTGLLDAWRGDLDADSRAALQDLQMLRMWRMAEKMEILSARERHDEARVLAGEILAFGDVLSRRGVPMDHNCQWSIVRGHACLAKQGPLGERPSHAAEALNLLSGLKSAVAKKVQSSEITGEIEYLNEELARMRKLESEIRAAGATQGGGEPPPGASEGCQGESR